MSMQNAKMELLDMLEQEPNPYKRDPLQIKCASLKMKGRDIVLALNYTPHDYDMFLAKLDWDYDSGWGDQELFGVVWLTDGSWLERGEYDGSEWWEHKFLPEIPQECL